MDFVNFALLGLISISALKNIAIAALGLGMVIFFHELGHFLVAKWCGVYVERFSIGFGQPILAKKWGETEYWLSWIPFGGYVKMLGQDDMDPSQMSDDMVAEDPRSYTAKSVPQRMAIISAGVIMNVVTGFIFFTIAFRSGIETTDRVIGKVEVGMPGWTHGLRMGDTITAINGRPVSNFEDILRGTALSRGPLNIQGQHVGGETFDVTLDPATKGIVRQIGLQSIQSLEIATVPEAGVYPYRLPGTSAEQIDIQQGDIIREVNGEPVENFYQFAHILNDRASEPLSLTVQRKGIGRSTGSTVNLELPPQQFVGFGLKMWIGKIEAVRINSPAALAGLKVGDKIAKVDGMSVESELDPYRLTEYFSQQAGQEVVVTVSRELPGSSPQEVTLKIVPEDRLPWSEPPTMPNSMLSIPSIGAAYHLVPNVHTVQEGSIAEQSGIQKRDVITKVVLKRSKDGAKDFLFEDTHAIEVGDKNWAYAYWQIQENGRSREIEVTYKRPDEDKAIVVNLKPQPMDDWYMPTARGLVLLPESTTMKTDDFGSAIAMAGRYTINSIEDIYLTIRGLMTRDISHKGLSGPLRIAGMAYGFADLGIGHFLRFLGLISVNLAVINFLPIPILDGGHMVFLMWEAAQRKKPPEQIVNLAHLAGFVLILAMMGFVFYQDIVAIFS